MRPLTNGQASVEADGARVRDVIEDLEQRFPGVKDRLCEGDQLRPGMAVAINGSVSTLGMLQRVEPNAEIHFLPAIGGG